MRPPKSGLLAIRTITVRQSVQACGAASAALGSLKQGVLHFQAMGLARWRPGHDALLTSAHHGGHFALDRPWSACRRPAAGRACLCAASVRRHHKDADTIAFTAADPQRRVTVFTDIDCGYCHEPASAHRPVQRRRHQRAPFRVPARRRGLEVVHRARVDLVRRRSQGRTDGGQSRRDSTAHIL